MNLRNRWTLLIFVLTLSLLACAPCGLSNLLDQVQGGIVPSETVVAEAQEIAGAVAQQATVVAEQAAVNEQITQTEETTEQQAAEVVEESADAIGAGSAADSDVVVQGGPVSLPNSIQDYLANFNSYQVVYKIEAETTEEAVKLDMLIEQAGGAQHFRMVSEGGSGQLGGVEEFEMYLVDDGQRQTMYANNPLDGGWVAITIPGLETAFEQMPVSPSSFGLFPEQGQFVGEEVLNGEPVNHYTFTENDFLGNAQGIQAAQGDIWVHRDKNFIVKAEIRVTGSDLGLGTQPIQFDSYTMICELLKYDDPSITVTIPEAALNSNPIAIPGSDDSNQTDLALPNDASVELAMAGMVNFTTAMSAQEVLNFYRQVFGPENIQVTVDTPDNVMATITGDTPGQILATREGGLTRVIVTTQ